MDDEDPVSTALQTRRLPHGRFKSRGPNKSTFDVFRAINEYEVTLGTGRSRARQRTGGDQKSYLTIHGLTPAENGLFATVNIAGAITGVAVLSGSRKESQRIVKSLEEDDDVNTTTDDDDQVDGLEEAPEDRRNRLTAAFAKNSFRNPKFWMRWKGIARPVNSDDSSASRAPEVETDLAYIVFTENSCQTFEGTLTCRALDWKNVKIRGDKVKSVGNETLDKRMCKEAWLAGRM